MKTPDREDLFAPAGKSVAYLGSVAVASPPLTIPQDEAGKFLIKHYSNKLSRKSLDILEKIFSHPSIIRRHFAFENPEILLNEDPDKRIERFTSSAVELSGQAIVKALRQAGVSVEDVTGLVVNTCTGYICPGISTYLIEKLGLRRNIIAYDLVGSGCGGGIPNLQLCQALLSLQPDGIILSVSVEICSATFEMSDDLSLIISNALFADGAAAGVVWNRPKGLRLVASASHYFPEYREEIRYIYKNGKLHNQLSLRLPKLVGKTVHDAVTDLLRKNKLSIEDIQHWAVHTGGEKIIAAIQSAIGLSSTQLRVSRDILANYGNMSSVTSWFVLHNILAAGVAPQDWCLMISFGAGFSVQSFLLQVNSLPLQISDNKV